MGDWNPEHYVLDVLAAIAREDRETPYPRCGLALRELRRVGLINEYAGLTLAGKRYCREVRPMVV